MTAHILTPGATGLQQLHQLMNSRAPVHLAAEARPAIEAAAALIAQAATHDEPPQPCNAI